ncbi:TPA: ferritin [candidate division CPR2 bacterium]|uniref:Rubrerythrin diiron-binding domain-containing protein n=1 Tax=candidate division CPR2 bacterium GW2011_GWC1_41_48 TaxID=1618344 RepID=A0A0G0W8R2_UNCC2|nr:MAG: hypothetical protein UT47_C0002G0156 [candidate division CPR2 bacterium GW2011_GWC2_39_35]KKR28295.1 MAG: hypothetical protein UT60_C0023G0003 [candidate division CPR2 bacterium GW2011_GWD2_39_7]KKS09370.1 MAG: hypothetical protein UU65_C0002G0148 [candidate division CPR2 bacterium GW2011_GWC1_41_48]OGB72435.1 MAG: hypothetical protein A2Y26_01720 [candidate division CPR2 bacterium GWD2_39_7]HBG82126.1 ferritin [candidate division CPR2 bacterium]
MKIFRCRICGDTYLGHKKPTNCPFCGANLRYLVPGSQWEDENDVVLSTISQRNLEEALKIEVSNAEFYKCAAAQSKDVELAGMFKALSKIEAEHASIHAKLLKMDSHGDVYRSDACNGDDEKNLEESLLRETNAVDRYTLFASQSEEPRVKEVFEALAEIEKDHIALDRMMSSRFVI